jgi:L-alanine-DL-glutamate epimerase-like enolase superfamily enzyme
MKIAGHNARAVRMPRRHSPNVRDGDTIDFVALTLRTDDGIDGIGYSTAANVMTPALKSTVEGLCELLVGDDPMDIEALGKKLRSIGGGGAPQGLLTQAISAIDVALWDIKGKALGQPVYKLLGGYRDSVPTYESGFLWRPFNLEELESHAKRLASEGFTSMKFRLGAEDSVAKEVARMQVMREAVGPGIDLMIDINQLWDVNTSITIGREMANYDIYWLEDPTDHEDLPGLARIAAALDTPITAGEYQWGITPFRHMLEARSIDIVMVDLLRVGGITQWMKVAHMAEAYNLPVVTHLAPEILVHAIAAAPNGLTMEYMPWAFGLFTWVPPAENGMVAVPQTPGLGLEFDEEALAKHTLAI